MRMQSSRIAVVGGGIAGLNCAGRLMGLGHRVDVFDRGRAPGGRAARRRDGGWRFEPGAPGAHALVRRLAAGLTIHARERIVGLARGTGDGWQLQRERGGPVEEYATVVIATPPEQALDLLAGAPGLARVVGGVSMEPCVVALAGFAGRVPLAARPAIAPGGSLELAVRQAAGQLRADCEAWVLYGETQFSEDNLACDLEPVARHLLDDFARAAGAPLPPLLFLSGHRWRHARVRRPLGMDCLYDPQLGLGVCGDWCRGTRIDDALASGRALAARIAAVRPQPLQEWRATGSG